MILAKLPNRKTVMILLALLATLAACADNAQRGGGRQQGGQQGPPPEAYTACEGQEEGAIVSIKTPKGETINATCTMINGKLAAVPEGHEKR